MVPYHSPPPESDLLDSLPCSFPTDDHDFSADILASLDFPDDDDLDYLPPPSDDLLHIRALHALDPILHELHTDRSEFYSSFRTDALQPNPSVLSAHFDGGSMATTTNVLLALWYYRRFDPFDPPPAPLEVADHHLHLPIGFGFLNIPSSAPSGSTMVLCLYTPSLHATIVSPYSIGLQLGSRGYTCVSDFDSQACSVTLHSREPSVSDVSFPQRLLRGLLFSRPVLFPPADKHAASPPTELQQFLPFLNLVAVPSAVHQLSRNHQRHLWHQRFGHINARRLVQAHQFAIGVPPLPKPGPLDSCPICAKAKLHKASRSQEPSRRATQCYQGISVDFGFIVQNSSADLTRVKRLRGLHGETCYCLIVDHFSGMLFGRCFASKAPPLDFLNTWLALYGLPTSTADCYVRIDLGGELGRCDDVNALFTGAGYHVEPTAPDSSHQNGPGERPHRTIADAIRTMLAGASLPALPFELCSGKKPDLRHLRVFGCRVYALPARP
jgi:hypothetical protein